MKHDDPIMDELRKVKEAIAKAHDYDAYKLAAHIRGREEKAAGKRRPQAAKRASRQRKSS
jgi:hypothetical protein